MVDGKEINPPPETEHIQFTESRITTTSHPKRHANEPRLKGFVEAGGRFLGLLLYRAVYNGDPDEPLDLDASGLPMLIGASLCGTCGKALAECFNQHDEPADEYKPNKSAESWDITPIEYKPEELAEMNDRQMATEALIDTFRLSPGSLMSGVNVYCPGDVGPSEPEGTKPQSWRDKPPLL